MENKKPIYLFIHLPKTAGTSLRNLLERNFDENQLIFIYQEPPGIWLDTLKNFDHSKLDKVRVLYGHFHFGIHELIDDYPVKYITMLRDPVQRVISTYYHYKSVPSDHSEEIESKNIGISEFISSGKYFETDNAMVRMISGARGIPFGKCSREIYKLAINNINNYFADVLIMERMDESISRLQKLLSLNDVLISQDNVSKQRKTATIDDVVINQIKELNKYDVMLYNYVLRRYKMKNVIENTKKLFVP